MALSMKDRLDRVEAEMRRRGLLGPRCRSCGRPEGRHAVLYDDCGVDQDGTELHICPVCGLDANAPIVQGPGGRVVRVV